MRIQAAIFSLMLSIVPFGAMAGAGHDHGHSHDPVTQSQAEKAAVENVAKIVASGKLDQSWKSIAVAKTEQRDYGGKKEWVVSFKNANVSDPAKQTLYVFLSVGGEYIAANFTGK